MTSIQDQQIPRAAWLDRFTMKLGQLLPTLEATKASESADLTFEEAGYLTPEEAAEIFCLELPPVDAGE